MHVICTKTKATVERGEPLVEGRVGLVCTFEFCPEWAGLAKSATFVGKAGVTVPIIDDRAIIPPEVFEAAARSRFKVGVVGKAADGTVVIPTIWAEAGIISSSPANGNYPDVEWEPTPDYGAQIQQAAENAECIAQQLRDDAAAGRFDGKGGERGPAGPQGIPGHTPTAAEMKAALEPELEKLNQDLAAVDRRLDRIEEGADKVDIFTLENATEGIYVSQSGAVIPNPDTGATDYIDLSGFLGKITYYFANSIAHQGAFYDADKTYISGFYMSGVGEHDITIPTGARYVRLSYVLALKDAYYCYAANTYLQKIDTVKINGTVLEKVDGAVDIPLAKTGGDAGLVKVSYSQGFCVDAAGQLNSYTENPYVDRRLTGRPLSLEHLDYALKAAMTDGRGADWNEDEQRAAWARLGLIEDLKSRLTFGPRYANSFALLSTNQTTFIRIGNLVFLNVACNCIQEVGLTDLDYLYQIPPAYAPKYNSVGLAYNSSRKVSGFCYVRGGSGQLVVKTADRYSVGNEVDISMFWTI